MKTQNLRPIHKYNMSNGSTLCNNCHVTITTGLTNDLYCEICIKSKLKIKYYFITK